MNSFTHRTPLFLALCVVCMRATKRNLSGRVQPRRQTPSSGEAAGYEDLDNDDDNDEDDDGASSEGGSRLTRQRSSPWDEHGIARQQEERRKVALAGGRARTWSHNGTLRGQHGKDARSSAEWAHLDAFQVPCFCTAVAVVARGLARFRACVFRVL